MMDLQTNGVPLTEALLRACEGRWNGCLSINTAERALGTVVMRNGRIGWAVCPEQTEDLGNFLLRLGRVRPEELSEVRKQYTRHGGRRKLGAIMEEMGLVPRPVLRRCLLLHTRMALNQMLCYPDAFALASECGFNADDELTFHVEEVVPELLLQAREEVGRYYCPLWNELSEENSIIHQFCEIPGYRAAVICSQEGDVIVGHTTSDDVQPPLIASLVAGLMEVSSRATVWLTSSPLEFVHLKACWGTLVARWIDEAQTHSIALVTGRDGNLGMTQYQIRSELPRLSLWLENRLQPPRRHLHRLLASPSLTTPFANLTKTVYVFL